MSDKYITQNTKMSEASSLFFNAKAISGLYLVYHPLPVEVSISITVPWLMYIGGVKRFFQVFVVQIV